MKLLSLNQKLAVKNIIKKLIERRYSCSFNFFKNPHHYYIIRRRVPWAGFFANYLFVAAHIKYALSKGYIPVVDMENFPTLYNETHEINGSFNGWEYYFEQPNKIKLSDAYASKNYIISDTSNYRTSFPYIEDYNRFDIDELKLEKFNKEICSLIPLKPSIISKLEKESVLFNSGLKVLGVHVRGTDKRKHVPDHHISASLDRYLEKTEEILQKYHVDKILLCCDEDASVAAFSKKFGELVVVNNAFRAKQTDSEGIHLMKSVTRKNHKYLLGYEVLRDCYMLSKCNYLIFSHSNVTNVALIWNNNQYIHKCFIEN